MHRQRCFKIMVASSVTRTGYGRYGAPGTRFLQVNGAIGVKLSRRFSKYLRSNKIYLSNSSVIRPFFTSKSENCRKIRFIFHKFLLLRQKVKLKFPSPGLNAAFTSFERAASLQLFSQIVQQNFFFILANDWQFDWIWIGCTFHSFVWLRSK